MWFFCINLWLIHYSTKPTVLFLMRVSEMINLDELYCHIMQYNKGCHSSLFSFVMSVISWVEEVTKHFAMSRYNTASSFNTVCEEKQLHLSQTIQCWCSKYTGLLFICHLLVLYWQGTFPVLNITTVELRITMLSVQHDSDKLQY